MIENAAQLVATREKALTDAEARHQEAMTALDALEARRAAVTGRLADIRTDHREGRLSDGQAGGIYAILREDQVDLERMVTEAEQVASTAAAAVAQARAALDISRHQLERAIQTQRADELADLARRLEDHLCDCIADLIQAGIMAGKTRDLNSHWRPSDRLNRAVMLRVPPTRGARP